MLPGHPLIDVITGRILDGGQRQLSELLVDYPVALLAPVSK